MRARRARYTNFQPCADCGKPTSYGDRNGYVTEPRCHSCNAKHLRASWDDYRAMVEAMWAEGMTAGEIGDALGWTVRDPSTRISQLRARGYDLPYRRSPEFVAQAKAHPERFARARAAWQASRVTW